MKTNHWKNLLIHLNRINYYVKNNSISENINNIIDELEIDGIYADWNDDIKSIWDGKNFTEELVKVEKIYKEILPKLSTNKYQSEDDIEELKK